jgi:hypothetical protein
MRNPTFFRTLLCTSSDEVYHESSYVALGRA